MNISQVMLEGYSVPSQKHLGRCFIIDATRPSLATYLSRVGITLLHRRVILSTYYGWFFLNLDDIF